jgi:hypothetical protein
MHPRLSNIRTLSCTRSTVSPVRPAMSSSRYRAFSRTSAGARYATTACTSAVTTRFLACHPAGSSCGVITGGFQPPAGRPHPTRDPVQRLGHAPQGRRHRVLTPGDHHLTASDHLLAPKDHFLAACHRVLAPKNHFLAACHRVLAPKNHFLAACHRVLAPGHGAPVTLRLPQQLIPLSRPLLPLSRQPITLGHQGIALGQQFVPRRRPRRELLVRSNVPLLEPRRDSVGNLPRHAREGLGGCWCNQGPWPRPPPGTSASPQPASASAPAPCRREHEVVDVDRVLPVHRASPPCRKIGEESFNSRRNQ